MNSALFAALLTIAAAPIVDVQAHLFIEPTDAGQAAAMIAQLDGDRARLLHLYEGELLDYARRTLAETGRGRRTLNLLQGSVSFRTVPASVRVSDPFRACEYATVAAPALVRTAVTVDAAGYRDQAAKHYRETGELLPGVETTPAHETHRISFGAKE